MVGYARNSKRDCSGIGDVLDEAARFAAECGRSPASAEDVHRAIYDVLIPSDKAFAISPAIGETGSRNSPKRNPARLPRTLRATAAESIRTSQNRRVKTTLNLRIYPGATMPWRRSKSPPGIALAAIRCPNPRS